MKGVREWFDEVKAEARARREYEEAVGALLEAVKSHEYSPGYMDECECPTATGCTVQHAAARVRSLREGQDG